MTLTPSLAKQAEDALIYAKGAKARHAKSADKFKTAQLLVARALKEENRKNGKHYERWVDRALQGNCK
jgi:hypothetical protein